MLHFLSSQAPHPHWVFGCSSGLPLRAPFPPSPGGASSWPVLTQFASSPGLNKPINDMVKALRTLTPGARDGLGFSRDEFEEVVETLLTLRGQGDCE